MQTLFRKNIVDKQNIMDCVATGGNVKVLAKAIHSLSRIGEELYLEPMEDGLLNWLLKTHNLSYQDCESLQAVFDKESCANVLQAQPRLMVDTVLHFPPSLEEVNLSVSSNRVWLRNHVEDDADSSRAMMTELCLSSEEFDHFAVGSQTSVTFCLKELRGLLVFAESSGLPVSMYFDEPGSPVILSVTDSVLEANFVLATLSEDSHPKNHVNSKHPDTEQPPDDFMSDDMDSFLIDMETSELPVLSHVPTSPPRPTNNNRKHSFSEEEEEEEALAEGPPNKKFCSLFFGSVLPTPSQLPNQTMQSQEVLASDSEDENQTETS
ncbi:cell cycle checkpoint control protein RAD9A-like [Sinocyclocheilus rhinocerous]|uniref:cell cycle checkpoint control protein RAD9A-like n=1 Tax=Sinocyclocheilus rhinocerous TaxID=307959 RepID=UPI0007B7C307|nr:PREDICTED: cell cycle checkpoint control protein RAD9A-like [Sinocyclocheilus rhinocerous]